MAVGAAYAICLLAGCATIVHGTSEKVQIDSTPSGAEVVIDGTQHAVTPAAVELSRKSEHTLKFYKAGYQDDTETLTSGVSAWVFGNLVSGGLVGAAIDVSDGAARKLSSDSVKADLKPITLGDVLSALVVPAASVAPAADAGKQAVEALPEGPPPEDFRDDEVDYGNGAEAGSRPDTEEPDNAPSR